MDVTLDLDDTVLAELERESRAIDADTVEAVRRMGEAAKEAERRGERG